MGEVDWLVLNDVIEMDAQVGPITDQALIEWQMLARRDQQNVANSREIGADSG
jgi:hypothetical protein